MRVDAAVRDEPEQVHVAAALARAAERRDERLVLEEAAVGDRAVDALEVLVEHAAGADRQMPDLGVAHLPGRQPDRLARGGEPRVRVLGPEPVEDRRVGELDRVPRPGRGAAPPVEDDERYERERAAASHIAANESMSSDAPPTSAPSMSGCGDQLRCVVGLDRAAVEHRPVEQRLDERVRLLRELGRRGDAGADRPHRLVGEHEPLVRAAGVGDRLDLDAQHGLGVAGVALLRRLADAGDDAEPRLERRRACAARRRCRSRRSTAAAPSGRRSRPSTPSSRSIAGEISPVYAPSSSQCTFWANVVRPASTHARKLGVRRRDDRRRRRRCRRAAAKRMRVRARGTSSSCRRRSRSDPRQPGSPRRPGSSLPSSSSRLAPPPVETHEILLGEAELVQRAHGVGAADDRERVARSRPPPRRPPSCPRRSAATRRRPSGRSRRSSARPRSRAAKRSRDSGPMSSPSQPSGSPSNG